MRSRNVISLMLLPTMVGCAAILAKKTTPVSMNSNPTGAEVWIDGNRAGTTPVTISLDHKSEHVVVFILDGHQETSCRLNRKVGAGWVILDVLLGVVPVIVDAATGSWHSLDSDVCNVQLPRGGAGPGGGGNGTL